VYLKHQFPLLAAVILLPAGCCLSVAIESLSRDGSHRRRRAAIMASVVSLLLAYYALIQVNNARTSTVVDLAWTTFLLRHSHATYALSYPPFLPQSEPIDWVPIDPRQASAVLERARRHRPLFHGLIPAGMKPRDYWIYQPVDGFVEFDAPSPACRRQDPALAALAWLSERFHRAPGKSATWVLPGTVAPGSRVVLGGTLDAPRRLIERIEMVDGGLVQDLTAEDTTWSVAPVNDAARPIKNAVVNCLRGSFIADVDVGEDASEGLQRISIRAVYRDGRKFEIGKIIFQIRRDAPRMTQPPVAIPTPHLSVDAVVQSNPGFPIAERGRRGDGYVVFDLRSSGAANSSWPSDGGH